MSSSAIVWLRRSLRLHDHSALSYATQNFDKVYVVFVFDKNILDKLDDKKDHRLSFIFNTIEKLKNDLKGKLFTLYGDPKKLIPQLFFDLKANMLITHEDYESYAIDRDQFIEKSIGSNYFKKFKDHIIFDASEIRTGMGDFYKVFTPYKNAWFKKLEEKPQVTYEKIVDLSKISYKKIDGFSNDLRLIDMGFEPTQESRNYEVSPQKRLEKLKQNISRYHERRDFPALDGTSILSPYLRFGQISIRELVRLYIDDKNEGSNVWLSELAWRDFYFGLLKTFPHIEKYPYNTKYEKLKWDDNTDLFKSWSEGRTGVPIVDAGMRQLNQTGWMHNRVRMIVASYLTKTLLLDWRLGEEYFAKKLIDFDLAANNGGWQWSASTGCDAAPYFRVFNPYRQSERFDPKLNYILQYVPEIKNLPPKYVHDPTLITPKIEEKFSFKHGIDYPKPIADYKKNRAIIIDRFKRC